MVLHHDPTTSITTTIQVSVNNKQTQKSLANSKNKDNMMQQQQQHLHHEKLSYSSRHHTRMMMIIPTTRKIGWFKYLFIIILQLWLLLLLLLILDFPSIHVSAKTLFFSSSFFGSNHQPLKNVLSIFSNVKQPEPMNNSSTTNLVDSSNKSKTSAILLLAPPVASPVSSSSSSLSSIIKTKTATTTSILNRQSESFPTLLSNTTMTTPFTGMRINCGNTRNDWVDPKTNMTWVKDQYISSLQTSTYEIKKCNMAYQLFCTYRLGYNIQYDIPVPIISGTSSAYRVKLFFMEFVIKQSGLRKMNITIENNYQTGAVLNYDVFATARSRLKPTILTFYPVIVKDGTLTISIRNDIAALKAQGMISGIMIESIITTTPAPLPALALPPAQVPLPASARAPSQVPVSISSPLGVLVPVSVPQSVPVRLVAPTPGTTGSQPVLQLPSIPSQPVLPLSPSTGSQPKMITVPFRMNVGYGEGNFTDSFGLSWLPEMYYYDVAGNSMTKSFTSTSIQDTYDDLIYQYVREGTHFGFQIPIPIGRYDITIHLVENEYDQSGQRIFEVQVENQIVSNIDLIGQLSKGPLGKYTKYTVDFVEPVDDGVLDIVLRTSTTTNNSTMLSTATAGLAIIAGIEVQVLGPHLAHAVTNGPYYAVAASDTGYGTIVLDGSNSHTHGTGLTLTSTVWTLGSTVLGSQLNTKVQLPVGEHVVTLTIRDSGGTHSADQTLVTVYAFGYPTITSMTPQLGSIQGNEEVLITGNGFNYAPNQISIKFGDTVLSGESFIQILNGGTTIKVLKSPPSISGGRTVPVSVITPIGESILNEKQSLFTYESDVPIIFVGGSIFFLSKVCRVRFGPDKNLYVSTTNGKMGKYLIDFNTMKIISGVVTQVVPTERSIMGIAFDPMELNTNLPSVYISHCIFFHQGVSSSSGKSINARISRVFGSNLDQIEDLITGLPSSDHDHGVNALEFGNHGELYINVAGNTNGGRPGKISSSNLQKDSYLSSAIVVAYLNKPDFVGTIEYSAADDGDMINTNGSIEVFANGVRNPFGLVMHSNGNLYATDNGPNFSYGNMLTGCGPNDFISGKSDKDKIILVKKDAYYGHPNLKRAKYHNDTRQCIWYPTTTGFDNSTLPLNYIPPIAILESSINGIIDYHANYFNGQLRGNLITSKYNDELYRVVLNAEGTGSIFHPTVGGTKLVGDRGLDLTLAPDGTIIEARYASSSVYFQKPIEKPSTTLKVLSVFPYRGRSTGGNTLTIYGINFTTSAVVTIQQRRCTSQSVISTKEIHCVLPGGTPALVDIVVTQGTATSTFQKGYRYITGLP